MKMARAHTVWIVIKNKTPVCAFTVKHELISWLKENRKGWNLWEVWKLPDGGHPIFAPTRLEFKEDLGL
jgi:hypothetical protein